ncbi:MAG: ribonuclease HII [Candidatus Aenigmatarchaeota archaeon]|nr:MAG: ribonuclease HII [Candidatus Aenigmarchaeota archaeon]RLJ08831.1 MAG: ribonuclease HII [Candidatus Aenigmarchaeota archaeon]
MEKLIIAGADESGRGAVIGPMIMVGVSIHSDKEHFLRKFGVKDSKELTAKKREKLSKSIEKIAKDIIVLEIGACKIDNYRRSGISMNKLEAMKFAEIINLLEPKTAYIDCPDTNKAKIEGLIRRMLNNNVKLVVEHFADKKYPSVSAASIIAKVERDKRVKKLEREYGEIGSGYPSDPITQEWLRNWLKENKDFPEIVRKTWVTAEFMTKERLQRKLSSFFKNVLKFG